MKKECKCTEETLCQWHYHNLVTHIDKQAEQLSKIGQEYKDFQKSVHKFMEKCEEHFPAAPSKEEQEKWKKHNLRVHFMGHFLSGLAHQDLAYPANCINAASILADEAIAHLEEMESKDA